MHRGTGLETINQFVLHKQHLAEGPQAGPGDLVQVVKDICGLHAQVAPTPYLSLWNRVENFQKEDLSKEQYANRALAKMWAMRATVHIVPTDHIIEYYQATKKAGGRRPFKLEPVHKKILKVVDEKGPLSAQELADSIVELKKRVQTPYGDMSIGQLRLRELSQSGILVPVKPKGGWKSSLHTYASFKTWLPDIDLEALGEQDAQRKLVSFYLSGFGPAAAEDIAWWIGIAKGEVKEILEKMSDIIQQVEIHGLDGAFFILNSDLQQLQKFSPDKDTVHLLPKFDSYIMGYKNRQRLVSPMHEKKVYWSTRAEVSPSVLINGRIIGTWGYKEEKNKTTITLDLFEKTDKLLVNIIKEESERLACFIGDKDTTEIILRRD